MVSPFISVERADNARRALSPGYEWQEYTVAALKVVDETSFLSVYNNRRKPMEEDMHKWEDAVKKYVNDRADQLGMWVGSMYAQLVEEPNESKVMEVLLWESRNACFVWSVWSRIFGPIPTEAWSGTAMPLFCFWPREAQMTGSIPEIVDASILSMNEKGML